MNEDEEEQQEKQEIEKQVEETYARARKWQELVDEWDGDRTALARSLGYSNARRINDELSIQNLDPEALRTLIKGDRDRKKKKTIMNDDFTTIKVYTKTRDNLAKEGKYSESMADIIERMYREWMEGRKEISKERK